MRQRQQFTELLENGSQFCVAISRLDRFRPGRHEIVKRETRTDPEMPSDLRLLFVRHGETQDNIDKKLQGWRDTDLTSNGHNDAQIVFGKLQDLLKDFDVPISHIYHSPLKRIKQTIAPIKEAFPDVPCTEDPDLRGQGMGDLEGGSYDLVDMSNPRSADGKSGVELFNDFVRRLLRSLGRVIGEQAPHTQEKGRLVIVATHGVCITSIFKALEDTPHCEGFFNTKIGERGPDAVEVRYPDSTDIAQLLVRKAGSLPLNDKTLDWDAVQGTPMLIEKWGRKDSALAEGYYSKK